MLNKTTPTIMTTDITLTAEQIALLLQILDEQLVARNIEGSDRALAFGVVAILEDAENLLCDIENRMNLGI
jgi:hypothetical protein